MSEILAILQPKQSIHGVLQPATTQQSDYNKLNNKPKINGVELSGDVSLEDLDVAESADTLAGYGITDAYTKTEVDAAINELDGNIDALIGSVSKFEASMKATRAYTVGDYINVHGKLYKANKAIASGATLSTSTNVDEVTIGDELKANAQSIATAAEQIASNAEEITNVKADLLHKANVDGAYSDLTAGNAEQLVSTVYEEDSVPYIFRTAGGSMDIGDREEDTIVGGSVVWNQILVGSRTPSDTHWRAISGTLTAEENYSVYKVTTLGDSMVVATKRGASHVYLFSVDINPAYTKTAKIYTIDYRTNRSRAITVEANKWNTLAMISPQSSETGLRELQLYLNCTAENGYSVGDEDKIRNFMLFDLTQMFGSTIADYIYSIEQANAGAGVAWFKKLFPADYYPYDAGTLKSVEGVSSHDMVGFNAYNPTTGTAKLVGGQQYQITGAYSALTFDSEAVTPDASGYFTPTKSGTLTVTGGNSTTTCVHLVWDGERDGEYEPYVKHSYPLDDSLILRGIPKLDSVNNIYYDGDRYLPDGTVERNYGIRAYQLGDENLANAITDGTNTVYKLTASTTETATPYQSLQVCDPNGTEEFVTTGIVPVGHETRYPENLRAKIEGLPWDFSTLIAPTESGTASRNYTVGSLLIMGNVLYKVTANIANGGTITPGTNCTATTLSEVISALQ